MDSIIPEGANKNPYGPFVEDFAGITKNYMPQEFRSHGRYNWLPIPEKNQEEIRNALLDLQNMLLPTMQKMRNQLNISQLQDRVWREIKKREEKFMLCQKSSRVPSEVVYCSNKFVDELRNHVAFKTKEILEEY